MQKCNNLDNWSLSLGDFFRFWLKILFRPLLTAYRQIYIMISMENKKESVKLLVIRETPELLANIKRLKALKKYKFATKSDLVREAMKNLVALELEYGENI